MRISYLIQSCLAFFCLSVPASASTAEGESHVVQQMLISPESLGDDPRSALLYRVEDGALSGGVSVSRGTVEPGERMISIMPEGGMIGLVVPAPNIASDPCFLDLRVRFSGRIRFEANWLDENGAILESLGNFETKRVSTGKSLQTMRLTLKNGTDPRVAKIALVVHDLEDFLQIQRIAVIRNTEYEGKKTQLAKKAYIARTVEPGEKVDWTVDVPRGGRFTFSTAYKGKSQRAREGQVVYTVEAVYDGNPAEEIFRETKNLSDGAAGGYWVDHRVDLNAFAGKRVTFTFEVERSGAKEDDRPLEFLWGDPLVFVPRSPDEPHVIIIGIDTFRQDVVGAYGNPEDLTPNIDRLAADGLLFEKAIATSSWTLPSFASIYTSLYPTTHKAGLPTRFGTQSSRKAPLPTGLSERVVTLAEILKQQGFATACFHNNNFLTETFGMAQGFDTMFRANGSICVDRALEFARSHRGRRLFIHLHFMEPHGPFRPRADFKREPNLEGITNAEERRRAKEWALYLGEIAFTDHLVGQFLEGLDHLQLRENTLLILTADHGNEFWEHYDIQKEHYRDKKSKKFGFGHGFSVYREVVDVPLVFRLPGRIEAGTRVSERVSLVDVAPTVLDWLGMEIPDQFVGHSLVNAGNGNTGRGYDLAEAFARTGFSRRAYYDGPWKLIAAPETKFLELYNLEDDPLEEENLATVDGMRALKMVQMLNSVIEWAEALHQELNLGDPPIPVVSEQVKKELKALGYID